MRSERLTYTNIKQGHEPLLFLLMTDERVREYLGGTVNETAANKRVLGVVAQPPINHWVISDGMHNDIGLIGLGLHHDGMSTEVSYSLLPQYWGKGYAYEALNAVVEWVNRDLKINYLLAETQTANSASIKLLRKCKFLKMNEIERFGEMQAIYQLNLLDEVIKKT